MALLPVVSSCLRMVLQVLSIHAALGCSHFKTQLCIVSVSIVAASILVAVATIHFAPVICLEPVDGACLASFTEECFLAAIASLLGLAVLGMVDSCASFRQGVPLQPPMPKRRSAQQMLTVFH